MYKSVIIADVHLSDNDSLIPRKDSKGRNLRTKDKINYINKAIYFSIKNSVDSFIIAGDLFHHNRPSNRLRAITMKLLSKLLNKGIKVYLIPGNHDMSSTYYNLHSETYVNKDLILANNSIIKATNKMDIHLLGWGNMNKLMTDPNKDTILISHLQIQGASYGDERIAKEGLEKTSKDIQMYKKCYLGHIHKRQSDANYQYIGALCKNDFNEVGNASGFLYLTIKENKYKDKFINISDRILKSFKLNVNEEQEIYEYFNDKDLKDKIISITISHSSDLFLDTYRIKNTLMKKHNPAVLKITYNTEKDLEEESIKIGIKDKEAFDEFLFNKDIPDFYIKLGKKILKEVDNQ